MSGKPKRLTIDQISAFIDVPQWLLDEHRESDAYAIAEHFHKSSKALASEGLKENSLFEVVDGELHSKFGDGERPNPHARYLEIAGDESLEYLKLLPKIPSSRAEEIRSPDFLVIRLRTGEVVRSIACIAAELDPDFETMSLRLITSQQELKDLERFIDYASRDSEASRPLGALIENA